MEDTAVAEGIAERDGLVRRMRESGSTLPGQQAVSREAVLRESVLTGSVLTHAAVLTGPGCRLFGSRTGRCHVNRHLASLWAPTPEIMQRSSLAATVSSRRRGIGGVFGGRPDGVGR